MNPYGSFRVIILGFGSSYLVAFFLLADLLGSSADETSAFTDHFDSDVSRYGDIVGAIALVAAAVLLVALGLLLRHELWTEEPSLRVDLLPPFAAITAAGLLVSAALLVASPLLQSLGDITNDPGLAPDVAAGVAQAGTVMLILTLFLLGLWTALVVRLMYLRGAVGRWFLVTGWVAAALAFLGWSVVAAVPLGLWWVALGLRSRSERSGPRRERAVNRPHRPLP